MIESEFANNRVRAINHYLAKNGVKSSYHRRQLIQAYRRLLMFSSPDTIQTTWVGLGPPSAFKGPFFRCISQETPRITAWYIFSKEGADLMRKLIKKYPWPKSAKRQGHLNAYIFDI